MIAREFVSVQAIATLVLHDAIVDLPEHGRKLVIVLLSPLIERMIVATRTLNANAEKNLSDCLGTRVGIAQGSIQIRRRILIRTPPRGNHLTGKHVEGLVARNRIAKPLMENANTLLIERLLFVAKQIAPLLCPEVRELGPSQNRIDQAFSFVRGTILQEGTCLLLTRQDSHRVQKCTPQESGIIRGGRRSQS